MYSTDYMKWLRILFLAVGVLLAWDVFVLVINRIRNPIAQAFGGLFSFVAVLALWVGLLKLIKKVAWKLGI